jgi:hypothetical protein
MAREAGIGVLEELSITGLGVIEEAQARFHPGFTVLTGETGAGKTIDRHQPAPAVGCARRRDPRPNR